MIFRPKWTAQETVNKTREFLDEHNLKLRHECGERRSLGRCSETRDCGDCPRNFMIAPKEP